MDLNQPNCFVKPQVLTNIKPHQHTLRFHYGREGERGWLGEQEMHGIHVKEVEIYAKQQEEKGERV
jgi:hypothetical protein